MGRVQAYVHDRESRGNRLHNLHRQFLSPWVWVVVDALQFGSAASKRLHRCLPGWPTCVALSLRRLAGHGPSWQ
jgi:hypothetical protein